MRVLLGSLLLAISCSSLSATTVVVAPLSELLKQTAHSAPAQVVNEDHAFVSARVSAEVKDIFVQVGDKVSAGQKLLQLDCRDHLLASKQAESALKTINAQSRLARQQLLRAEKLLKQKNASIELRDQRRAELDSLLAQQRGAQAVLDTAKLAVERCTPSAPYDGVVTEQLVSTGDLTIPGTPLLRVLSDAGQEVSAALNVEQVARLQSATDIAFALNGEYFPLKLRASIPLVNSKARTQEVRLSFMEASALSGSSGRIEWLDSGGRLPAKYVVSREGQLGLMQVINNKANFVKLPKAIEGQAVEVALPEGSLIIVEGQHAVNDQEVVTLVNQE